MLAVPHDVFISHSAKDKAVADAICAALETNGVRCWIAPRDIVPGASWANSILKGINSTRVMVLVFSAYANQSPQVRREVERAVHRGIPIAPVRIQDVLPVDDLEYFLSSSHWMDALTPPFESHLGELTSNVKVLLELHGHAPAAASDIAASALRPPVVSPRRSWSLTLALLLTCLLLSIVAVVWTWRGDLARRFADGGPHPAGTAAPTTLANSIPASSAPAISTPTTAVAAVASERAPTSQFTRRPSTAFASSSPTTGVAPAVVIGHVITSQPIRPPATALATSLPATAPSVAAEHVATSRPVAPIVSPLPETAEAKSRRELDRQLNSLKDLFLADRITAEHYQLGQRLCKSAAAELNEYDSLRRAQFLALLDRRLPAENFTAALAAIESPEQKTARLLRAEAERKEAARQSRIAQLLASARAADSPARGQEALASLDELLKLDSANIDALRLRDKIAAYYGFTNTLAMKFLRIEPGEFLMGSPATENGRSDNETQHKVKITKPFFLGIHHVTHGQFVVFTRAADYQSEAEKEGFSYNDLGVERVSGTSWINPGFEQNNDHPVVQISWNDAQAFCTWLSKKEGKTYRLPTEAEWEYACRAGTQTAYFWGNDPDGGKGFCNAADMTVKEKFPFASTFNWADGFVYTAPVGSFKPNPWGLYDMIGNAWEWCSDYGGPYPPGDAVDPTGPAQGDDKSSRVFRGGSWCYDPRLSRAAFRFAYAQSHRDPSSGFRCAVDCP